jgi:hypothetical protein
MSKNITKERKLDQVPIKYTDIFHCKTLQNFPKIWIFGFKTNHLATLSAIPHRWTKLWDRGFESSHDCFTWVYLYLFKKTTTLYLGRILVLFVTYCKYSQGYVHCVKHFESGSSIADSWDRTHTYEVSCPGGVVLWYRLSLPPRRLTLYPGGYRVVAS